ncbi:MAG TPA: VWA domain-containing protein [Terriglobales bacterium]|nr:VWA domain-containing protein [Terriglobales bacterium]
MRRRNNVPLLFFFLLITLFRANSQGNQTAPAPVTGSESPGNSQAATQPAPTSSATPSVATGQGVAPDAAASGSSSGSPGVSPDISPDVSPKSGQNPDSAESGVFVFRKQVDEVVLHATVVDDKKHIVTSLDKGDFNVYEDGRPQTITSFRHEDIPVAMGIVVDNSGSMREKRQKVNAAALNLVRSSNPSDEVFVVNFNDEYYLDQDFTSNINKLKEGLEKIEARGGTALYDAVVASADHLKKEAKLEKKVILVVTDGDDNESAESLEQAVRRLQGENGPTVYAIGILEGEEHPKHARRALQIMSERTGGLAFFPKTLDEVDAISRSVAHDIRTQYTIGYKPTTPKNQGGYRQVKVDARSRSYGKLTVRTKSGYYAGGEPASGAQ